MVKIDRVTTRTGDDGRTVLGDGARLPKFHPRIAAYGSLDEANSFIGLARLHVSQETGHLLARIQNDLFDVGADLCKPERSGLKAEPLRVIDKQVAWLEEAIEGANRRLGGLTSFVLPGGSEGAALLHVARSVVRRAEREVTEIAYQEPVTPAALRYVNRLSDLLFVLARVENDDGRKDTLWSPGASREG
ncbi:cob(I)yrinic acid a,c-diamide adenosyltransferase [Belnapia sp. T6]|uniref:Corrinoid adenosyltransferase n=1 Tax=Belnapia mucosa TaxID=2804532 RepID=A0ABS1V178_9PROT|nr:cob(I)yrinic acid a,c-diamide adenosyltransferase [Belnapia mucosa]MBL6455463.1 cob(I)yrinic acid a,c-diamide adenosyltransferase [Belnapia mucosa]